MNCSYLLLLPDLPLERGTGSVLTPGGLVGKVYWCGLRLVDDFWFFKPSLAGWITLPAGQISCWALSPWVVVLWVALVRAPTIVSSAAMLFSILSNRSRMVSPSTGGCISNRTPKSVAVVKGVKFGLPSIDSLGIEPPFLAWTSVGADSPNSSAAGGREGHLEMGGRITGTVGKDPWAVMGAGCSVRS